MTIPSPLVGQYQGGGKPIWVCPPYFFTIFCKVSQKKCSVIRLRMNFGGQAVTVTITITRRRSYDRGTSASVTPKASLRWTRWRGKRLCSSRLKRDPAPHPESRSAGADRRYAPYQVLRIIHLDNTFENCYNLMNYYQSPLTQSLGYPIKRSSFYG